MGLGFQASIQLFQWTVDAGVFAAFSDRLFVQAAIALRKPAKHVIVVKYLTCLKEDLSPSRDNPANENVSTQSLSWAYFLQEIKTALER